MPFHEEVLMRNFGIKFVMAALVLTLASACGGDDDTATATPTATPAA